MSAWARPFLESTAPTARARFRKVRGLERMLQRLLEDATKAWPDLNVAPEAFVRHLAGAMRADRAPREQVTHVHAGDLFLACACASRVAGAARLFQRQHDPLIRRTLRSLRLPRALAEDVRAAIYRDLFVGRASRSVNGAPRERRTPEIAKYSGRSNLSSWLRSVTTRVALSAVEAERRSVPVAAEWFQNLDARAPELELLLMKRTYAKEFKAALNAALDGLPARDRDVLRRYFVEAQTVDEVACVHAVHRSTAARWISAAAERLRRHVQRQLGGRSRLSSAEIAALASMGAAELEVTLSRLLPASSAGAPESRGK